MTATNLASLSVALECDRVDIFTQMNFFPLPASKTCVCINSLDELINRSLMTPSMMTSTLLKTALPAAVVVVRVVVVVGNAP